MELPEVNLAEFVLRRAPEVKDKAALVDGASGRAVTYRELVHGEATAATITDRWLRIIKYKGFQVFPAELEMPLLRHPDVADAAVIAVEDPDAGEIPNALVVPRSDTIDTEAVLSYVAEQVGPYKRIRAIELIEEIPKSQSGRILRPVLQERGGRR